MPLAGGSLCAFMVKNHPRHRLELVRSVDGKKWEYLMDVWRWDDVSNDRLSNIYQVVDPSITITEDYIFVTAGWSERTDSSTSHNAQRQTMVKFDKSELVAYDSFPEDYAKSKDILNIEVAAPDKTSYQKGETLEVTGGYLTVYYYDGTNKVVNLTASGVEIQEPDETVKVTPKFSESDMNKAGEKFIRVTYKGVVDNFTIYVEN